MREVIIGTTEFAVTDECVQEWGTLLRWSPEHPRGYQVVDGRMVSLMSYGAFGDDLNRARKCADIWCSKAREAWEQIHGPIE